ncbi:MAG: GNAT family N-acetyltransferase [Firmicutes bacterium]|nr:GNAT family N-acetyltransferase [Bacillota bacterium]
MKILENIDNVEEYNYLFDIVGWGSYPKEISKKALSNNIYSVSIYDNDNIIGYGRLIGDGIIFLYIHDIMVKPEYQGKGIGKTIMQKLLSKVEELRKENPDLLLYLGASKGKEEFYRKCGFITREEAGLGAGMIYNEE